MPGDEASFLLFSFNVLSNQIYKMTTGTAVNPNVGTSHGLIILQSEIYQADVHRIHNIGIYILGHL